MHKENKNNNFIQQFLLFFVGLRHVFTRVPQCIRIVNVPFWSLEMSVLLSMQCRKALVFHQKYLNLCSEDEQRSHGFGTT